MYIVNTLKKYRLYEYIYMYNCFYDIEQDSSLQPQDSSEAAAPNNCHMTSNLYHL